MSRRGRLGALAFVALAVALAAVVVVEWGGRVALQRVALSQLRSQGVAGQVEVTVGSHPWRPSFLGAYFGGNLDSVEVVLTDAEIHSLPIAEADYVLEGLDVDMSVRNGTLIVSGVRSGSVRLLIDPGALGDDLGVAVAVEDGSLRVGDAAEPASLEIDGADLVVRGAGVPDGEVRLDVVDPQMLPCRPDVDLRGESIVLACEGSSLPGVLATPLGSQVADSGDVPVELESPASTIADGGG